jgi:uncharacterized membrane protein
MSSFASNLFKSSMSAVPVAAATFGAAETSWMIWLNSRGILLPCANGVCEMLEKDPIASPFGIPLRVIGAVYFCALLVCVLAWLLAEKAVGKKLAVGLSGAGSAIGLALMVYVLRKTGSLCPLCSASTVASLLVLGGTLAVDSRETRFRRNALGSFAWLASSVLAASFTLHLLQVSLSKIVIDTRALSELPLAQLTDTGRSFDTNGPGDAKQAIVAVVDFGCGACRRALRALEMAPGVSVSLRFLPSDTDYSREAALLYLDAKSSADRKTALSGLLEDDTRTLDTVDRLRSKLKLPEQPSPHAIAALQEDTALVESLHVKASPVLIVVQGDSRYVASGAKFGIDE